MVSSWVGVFSPSLSSSECQISSVERWPSIRPMKWKVFSSTRWCRPVLVILQQVPDLAAIDVARHAHVAAQARVNARDAVPAGAE